MYFNLATSPINAHNGRNCTVLLYIFFHWRYDVHLHCHPPSSLLFCCLLSFFFFFVGFVVHGACCAVEVNSIIIVGAG